MTGALQGLRTDLLHDVFAFRPLAPMATDGPVTRRLPDRIRAHAGWTPHAVVLSIALFVFALAFTAMPHSLVILFIASLTALAVVMTLIRPIAAFWLALFCAPLAENFSGYWNASWTPSSFIAYLTVMTVVALRTRPRTAAWMWLVTAAYVFVTETFLATTYYSDGSSVGLLFVAALMLLAVTVWHVRRDAEQEVAAQQTVTAVERDRRTLLEERTTIARELHDVVAHHMSVVAIQAEAAPYRVENPPPELEQAFITIRENAVAALGELRRILGVVRAEDYEAPDAPQPVLADLDTLIANVREAGLDVEKTGTGAVRPLPPGVELSAYRIVQEALSNTLRHAPGSSARVEVSYVLGGLGLRIVNTAPRGLVKASPGAGHGITGMRERVTMLDGVMTNEPTEDGGYEVTAFIPVAPPATASEESPS
ncbi:histidine kinase [Streptomyces sp. CAU 1734]|uniref:sensor histidine kinase n=1 Tax=Streptomyces sp. CAU 1734 TaxID=3140360 RepID=UPI0032610367